MRKRYFCRIISGPNKESIEQAFKSYSINGLGTSQKQVETFMIRGIRKGLWDVESKFATYEITIKKAKRLK